MGRFGSDRAVSGVPALANLQILKKRLETGVEERTGMTFKKALLGTTALLGVGAIVMPTAASAQDIDVSIGGFLRLDTVLGDVEEALADDDVRDFDFETDNEVHFIVEAVDEQTGIEYGGTVELEADPDVVEEGNDHIDESWLFISGGFGEFRFGDEDGAVDNMKIGGQTVAAGTGGIDGNSVVIAGISHIIDNSGDATKIRYDSPVVGGFQLGVSYTPDGGGKGGRLDTDIDDDEEDWVEAGLVYTGGFGGFEVEASVVGGFADNEGDGDDFQGIAAGLLTSIFGVSVAGGYFQDERANGDETSGFSLGAGAGLGPANVSVTYAYNEIEPETGDDTEPQNLVVSGDVGLVPGVSLGGDVAFFDRDDDDGNDGISGVVRIGVAF